MVVDGVRGRSISYRLGDYGCDVYGEYYEHCDGGEMVRDGLKLDGVYLFLGCFPGFQVFFFFHKLIYDN